MYSCSKNSLFAIIVIALAIILKFFGFVDNHDGQKQDQNARLSLPASSYLSSYDVTLERLAIPPSAAQTPDTTAVILNWSRLPNVVQIVNTLCEKSLESTIATVLVWNNSPQKLTGTDFAKSQCQPGILKIHNSPSNLYFQARFLACAGATTQYCFIQDDDYLVRPEIILTLHRQVSKSDKGIHLLPPHEKLTSDLRTIRTGSKIHTSFAWLGHGAMIPRFRVVEFLNLLYALNVTNDELNMADNYFTILSNTFTETWFDQGVELGGGQPFSVGVEGDERNKRHIIKAFEILESITGCSNASCIALPSDRLSYVNIEEQLDPPPAFRAPCNGSICLFETSIDLLPDAVKFLARTGHILTHEATSAKLMGEDRRDHYLNHPPSHAVDGRPDTAFCSFQEAREGDIISLDPLGVPSSGWTDVEFVFLVDIATEEILQTSTFEATAESRWVACHQPLLCMDSGIKSPGLDTFLRECRIQLWPVSTLKGPVRARLRRSMNMSWCVFEVWMRGSRRSMRGPARR